MRTILLILLAVFLVLAVLVALANARVQTTYTLGLGSWYEASLAQVIFVSTIVGVAVTGVLALIDRTGLRLENRRRARRISDLERENQELKRSVAAAPPLPAAGPATDYPPPEEDRG
jgi:uncharacterized membrane protein YciS (DUF1049 family)